MQTPAIEMKGITKIYPNDVVANKDVDFSVDYGEIHAVMGGKRSGQIHTHENAVWIRKNRQR